MPKLSSYKKQVQALQAPEVTVPPNTQHMSTLSTLFLHSRKSHTVLLLRPPFNNWKLAFPNKASNSFWLFSVDKTFLKQNKTNWGFLYKFLFSSVFKLGISADFAAIPNGFVYWSF